MKVIKAKDIKAMQLTETEQFAIDDIIADINKQGTSDSLNITLQYGSSWHAVEDGVAKMVKYFATVIIKSSLTNDFRAVCLNVANVLGASSFNVARWLKGMRETFYIADQFGQNYIELN